MAQRTLTVAVFDEGAEWALEEHHVARIREAAGDAFAVGVVRSRRELAEALPRTNAIVGFPVTRDQIEPHLGRLEFVQLTHSMGDRSAAVVAALEAGVRVCSAATIRAPQVAEHAVALTLMLVRRIDAAVLRQAEHRWSSSELGARIGMLRGSTVGLVAMGVMGEQIAQRLKAFGVTTLATRREPTNPFLHVDEMFPTEDLNEMLARCDVVIVAAPRVPLTRHLMGRKQFAAMRRSAVLVDVSRGGVVDQQALIDALRRGSIASAALDVFETEPLPSTSPFWTMPNVVVTPHVAAASPAFWEQATDVTCNNLRRLRDERELIDELDLERFKTPARS
jgi:D-2-hydroxyacid dehydrogenase (NADP+)